MVNSTSNDTVVHLIEHFLLAVQSHTSIFCMHEVDCVLNSVLISDLEILMYTCHLLFDWLFISNGRWPPLTLTNPKSLPVSSTLPNQSWWMTSRDVSFLYAKQKGVVTRAPGMIHWEINFSLYSRWILVDTLVQRTSAQPRFIRSLKIRERALPLFRWIITKHRDVTTISSCVN